MSLAALARGSVLYGFANLLPRLGAFLLLPVYVNFLSRSDFGTISLILSITGVLVIVYRAGLDTALMRLHFAPEGTDVPRLYGTLAVLTLGAALAGSLVIGALLAPLFDDLFAGLGFVPFGLLALAITLVMTPQYLPSVLFRAREEPGRYLILGLATFVATAALSVYLVMVLRLGSVGALLGQLIGHAAVTLVGLAIVLRLGRLGFDSGLAGSALRFGLPLLPHGLAGWLLNVSDRWLIVLFIGLPAGRALEELGVYAFGYQIGIGVSLVATSFNTAWAPYFFRRGQHDTGPRLHREMGNVWMAGLTSLAVGVAALAPEIAALLAPPSYAAAAPVIALVALGSVLHGLYMLIVGVVFLSWRTSVLPLITLISGVANVAVNVLLLPRLGIIGAALATVVSFGALALGTYLYARRIYPIDLDIPRLLALGGAALAAVSIAWASGGGTPLAAAIHLAVAIGFAALAVALSLAPLRRLREMAALGDDHARTAPGLSPGEADA